LIHQIHTFLGQLARLKASKFKIQENEKKISKDFFHIVRLSSSNEWRIETESVCVYVCERGGERERREGGVERVRMVVN
jgi:hypothetical protein